MIVVDASVVVAALAGEPAPAGIAQRLRSAADLHAPHLLDIEVAHALRRLARLGVITERRARDALLDAGELDVIRYPHDVLLARIWGLRHNVSAYDAAYLALAEALDAPLLTCDARLARASGHAARVELLEPSGHP